MFDAHLAVLHLNRDFVHCFVALLLFMSCITHTHAHSVSPPLSLSVNPPLKHSLPMFCCCSTLVPLLLLYYSYPNRHYSTTTKVDPTPLLIISIPTFMNTYFPYKVSTRLASFPARSLARSQRRYSNNALEFMNTMHLPSTRSQLAECTRAVFGAHTARFGSTWSYST